MISLCPITYPNLIEKQLKFVSLDSSKRILTFEGDIRTYNHKWLKISIDNRDYIDGSYNCDSNGVETLTFFEPVEVSASSDIKVYETFPIDADNRAVTYQDIYDSVISIAAKNIDDSLIKNNGSPGLISGFDKTKLDSVIYDFKHKELIKITNSFVRICNLKLDNSTINHFRVILYSESVNGLFDAILTVTPNCEYYSIRIISHLLFESNDTIYSKDLDCNNLKLKLTKTVYVADTSKEGDVDLVFIGLDLGFENNSKPNKEYKFQLYTGANGLDSFKIPTKKSSKSEQLKLNGSLNPIICDKTLISVDVNNEQRTIYDNETILKSKHIGFRKEETKCYDLKAGYHLIDSNKKPEDIPTDISFETSTIIVFNDSKTMLFITDSRQMFIGIKNDNNKNIDWTEIGYKQHKHDGSDINQDSNHRFVTDEEKTKWNGTVTEVSSSVWKNPVTDETKLPTNVILNTIVTVAKHTKYGNNPVVLQQVAENVWQPLNSKIFQTDISESDKLYPGMTGSLVSPTLMAQIKTGGIGKSLTAAVEKEQFIHTLNEAHFYSGNNKFFDINKRTNKVTIGNYVVSFGFENTDSIPDGSVLIGSNIEFVKDANSVLIGSGLQGSGVHLGSYNKNNGVFTIGNGTNKDSRSNLFWITNIGQATTKATGSFKIDGIPETEILVSGGHIPQTSFVSKSELKQIKDEFVTREFFTYFKHEAKDKNVQVPVIVNISAPSNMHYYKKIINYEKGE